MVDKEAMESFFGVLEQECFYCIAKLETIHKYICYHNRDRVKLK